MKKLYSTLALAALVAASASAASPKMAGFERSLDHDMQALPMANLTVEASAVSEKNVNPTRAAYTIDDICQVYNCPSWEYLLTGTKPDTGISYQILKAEGNQVYLDCSYLSGFAQPLLATFDAAAQTLTINASNNQGLFQSDQHGALGIELLKIEWGEPDEDGMRQGQWVDTNSVTVNILEDGRIDFDEVALMWKWVDKGSYNFSCARFVLTPFQYFTYVASDWEAVDEKAVYTDGVFEPLVNAQYKPYVTNEVPLMRSTKESGVYLLMNPYNVGELWPQFFSKFTEGYIRFDISNPDCVTMTPLVPSGAWIDFSEGEDGSEMEQFFIFNTEGMKLYNGMSTEAQVEEVEEAMDPFKETLRDYLSYYDEETRTVTFKNVFFGQSTAPTSSFAWVNQQGEQIKLSAKVVLPESVLSVDNILSDDSNAPVKYFNLQGMEVAAPEAGQLVIMKKGTKASKFIAK